jgi:hypothetical protein
MDGEDGLHDRRRDFLVQEPSGQSGRLFDVQHQSVLRREKFRHGELSAARGL